MRPDVSIVVPMYDEAANASTTLDALGSAIQEQGWSYELIPVDDGSADETGAVLAELAEGDDHIKPQAYPDNRGRGFALRRGFTAAQGRYVVSMDADLSYSADHAARMVRMLVDDPEIDIVLASPYMPGGAVEDVPFVRLAFSKVGNSVLRRSLAQPVFTSTGIVRAYRADVLRSLDLESDGKEIHLEILSESMALGYNIQEMPATLRSRTKGTSKFRPKATVVSHLSFSMLERPASLFAAIAAFFMVVAMLLGAYLLFVFFSGELNPERPLMTLTVLLFLAGAIGMSFAILAMQLVGLRRSMVRLHAEMLGLRQQVEEMVEGGFDRDE